jgi:hypothetical protein
MSVATSAAASAARASSGGSMAERIMEARKSPGGLAGALGGGGNLAMQALMKAGIKSKKANAIPGRFGAVGGGIAGAVGGDNGRLDTIESRIKALEGGTEEDVTQPSPTVQEENSLQPQAPSPFKPKQTVAAMDMFGDEFTRKASFGPGKIITNKKQ